MALVLSVVVIGVIADWDYYTIFADQNNRKELYINKRVLSMIKQQRRKEYTSPAFSVYYLQGMNLLNESSIQDGTLHGDAEELPTIP